MTIEISEKYWSKFQATYDKNQEAAVGKELLNEIKEKIKTLPGLGEVLELGCGTGYFTETIVQKADHLFATDLSDELLESAAKRINNNNVTFQKKNCMSTSFPPAKFDALFMANLIHVIEDPLKALQECHRVLKKDGLLIVTSFTSYGMKPWEIIKMSYRVLNIWRKPPKHIHRFSPDRLGALMKSAGFSIEESKVLGDKSKSLYLIGKKK